MNNARGVGKHCHVDRGRHEWPAESDACAVERKLALLGLG
jgi:hypothetical protein